MEIFAGLFVFALIAYGIFRFIQREKSAGSSSPKGGGKDSEVK